MENKDWLLRIKGRHAITVYTDGEVRYSVGKQKLFILKKDALQELESLVRLNLSVPNDSTIGNVIRYNNGNKVFTFYNLELYTKIWKIIYDASSVKGNIEELKDLTRDVEYIITYGDLLSEVALDAVDPRNLIDILGIDMYNDSLIHLILSKNNEIYY